MAQTEGLGDVIVMGYGEDAACGTNALLADDHGTIVEGRVLEKYIFYETLRNDGVNGFAGFYDFLQGRIALDNDEGTHFLLTHT